MTGTKKFRKTASGLQIDARTYMPYFLSTVNNRLSWGASRLYLKVFGIGLNEWRVLNSLNNEPGIRALRITEMVTMNKSIVSRSLRVLEKLGHVRTVYKEGNRQLFLTSSGTKLHDQMIEVALQRESALMTGFSEAEKEVLHGFMKRMQINLERVQDLDDKIIDDKTD